MEVFALVASVGIFVVLLGKYFDSLLENPPSGGEQCMPIPEAG